MLHLALVSVVARQNRGRGEEQALVNRYVDRYMERARRYQPCDALFVEDEPALLKLAEKAPGRAAARLFLFDPRGRAVSSDELAELVRTLRDEAAGRAIFAVGPADGWSERARAAAAGTLSFGRITLPHELARVVAAEQIYRALTILAGHPYHCGH